MASVSDFEGAAEAGGNAQEIARGRRQAADAQAEQIENVLGDGLGLDALRVPAPAAAGIVEPHQLRIMQEVQKLRQVERIALAARVQQIGERQRFLGGLRQGGFEELAHVDKLQRAEMDALHVDAGLGEGAHRHLQAM